MKNQWRPAVLSVLVFTLLTGFAFPAVVTGIASVLFPRQAHGSLVRGPDGRVVGSTLIAQGFSGAKYFHPRPSSAGTGYDASASGGSNLGPTSRKLIDETRALADAYRRENGLAEGTVIPADAVTRSASGLDPHISPANAMLQAARVAAARGMKDGDVRAFVTGFTEGREVDLFGEPRVNVLELNLALDRGRKPPLRAARPVGLTRWGFAEETPGP
jgi:K+-transporting ATPase ATPase C chain